MKNELVIFRKIDNHCTSKGYQVKDYLSVTEAAFELKLSIDTIRRWEKKGLIKAARDKNNRRIFDKTELQKACDKYVSGGDSHPYQILKSKKVHDVKCIELFAVAGGLALGLKNAGIKSEMLIEIDKDAAATLKHNLPGWNVVCDDARNIDYTDINADVVSGGFPCQAFSYAGSKLGFEDARGTLFFELLRCVKEVRPKIVLGENVRGLLRHENGRTLSTMVSLLEEQGYRVTYKVARAQYLDVPQKRERLIIWGIRNDLDYDFFFPKERDYTISIREALKNIPDSLGQKYPARKAEIMKLIPPGGYWRDLPLELQKEYMRASFFMGGGKTGMARRLAWDEPSLTLTCAPAQKQTERCHPGETRPLNVREYARIQTFPDTWDFCGKMTSQYKQIGNAVPVNLGYYLGKCILNMMRLENTPNEVEKFDGFRGHYGNELPLFAQAS
ncbi:MAG: DNA (cytosine-5-)-methyltransferase [Holosporales bacterium]